MSKSGIKNFSLALLAVLTTACGEASSVMAKLHGDKSQSSTAAPAASPAPADAPAVTTTAPTASPTPTAAAGLLTLTFAPGTVVPVQLKATSLVLKFVTNDLSATFQCKALTDVAAATCPDGASYNFGNLVHSRSYSLIVVAHTADGRTSLPLTVSFVADLLNGMAPSLPGAPSGDEPLGLLSHVPQTPASLADNSARLLQVGSFYAVSAPNGSVVTGYSTDKTYNTVIHSMRLMGPSASSIYPGQPCKFSYERLVTIADGSDYCDGTPNEAQWASDYSQPMPKNYIEVVLPTAAGAITANEKIMVAAYDAEADASEGNMGLGSLCQGASLANTSVLQMLNVMNATTPLVGSWTWCQVRDAQGAMWWLGSTEISLTSNPTGPRVRLSYSAASADGLFGSPAYLEKTVARITAWVQPIAS